MASTSHSPDQSLLVSNAPPHFLKQRIIKSHFGRFGQITAITVHKNSCTVTFINSDNAEQAKKLGRNWKNYKLEIGYPSANISTSAFEMNFDIESELNWFAEEEFPTTSKDPLSFDDQEMMELKKTSNSPKRTEESDEILKKKIFVINNDNKEFNIKKSVENKQEVKVRGNEEEDFGELLSKRATTLNGRLALLEERDKLLRICVNRDSNIKTASSIKGTCPDMCPEKERILRDVRGIVGNYESDDGTTIKMDHNKAIKDYARSSADQEEPLPHDLRPEPVLTMTLDYIITQIMPKIDTGDEDNLGNWYDFCWYRLRSIRKDIIQQQLCDSNVVEIVERCARFHICCFDRLWGSSKSIFDDKINSETLMNCLQSLMHMYEDLRKQSITCPNEAEFRAYLILLKLNSGFLLSEYQQYSAILQKSSQVKDAVLIHTAYSNNMYSTYFSLMKKTSYLNSCLMQRFLAHLRTKALEIIVRAHCPPNKISRLPLNLIMQTLKFDSSQDCIQFCESFGLALAEDSYNFIVSRNDFFFPESLFIIKTPSSIVIRKRVPVANAVIGVHAKLPVYIPHHIHSSFNEDGYLKQSALDASDQEEKLYRDIVERKLILKRGSLNLITPSPTPETIPVVSVSPPSPVVITDPVEIRSEEEPEFINIISDEENNSNQGDVVDMCTFNEDPSDEDTEFNEHLSDVETITSSSSEEFSETETEPEKISNCNFDSKPEVIKVIDTNLSSPCSTDNIAEKPVVVLTVTPKIVSPTCLTPSKKESTTPPAALFKSGQITPTIISSEKLQMITTITAPKRGPITPVVSVPAKKTQISPTISTSPKILQKATTTSSPWNFFPELQCKPEKSLPTKEKNVEEKILTKLKKTRATEKMKKVSLRKYALLWRNKAQKLKKVGDKSLREYLFYWGSLNQSSIPTIGFRERLDKKKKTKLVVLSILHSNVVDRLDPAIGMVGELLSNALAELSLNFSQKTENISKPYPVFWKLIFAIPPSLKGRFTFPDKLRMWCKTAFYTNPETKLGDVQYRLGVLGVPTFISVNLIEGNSSFEEHCTNVSAAVILRAHGWETITETEQRCDNLIKVADKKFPMAILTLGDSFQSCAQLNSRNKLSYFCESLWNDTDKLVDTLLNLAKHTSIYSLKVDSLGSIISLTSEKLFDTLHEDSYVHDGLYNAICVPNNIIRFYNDLINEIEKEIITCYRENVYGTACEFEQYITKYYSGVVQLPNHYKDIHFRKMLKKHLQTAILPEIKWPFQNSKDLLDTFRNYCHNLDCSSILSKIIRIVNPPDSDDTDKPLNNHLELIPWLRIVEDLVKVCLKQDIFQFNVVYREKKIMEIIDSRWWMLCDMITKK